MRREPRWRIGSANGGWFRRLVGLGSLGLQGRFAGQRKTKTQAHSPCLGHPARIEIRKMKIGNCAKTRWWCRDPSAARTGMQKAHARKNRFAPVGMTTQLRCCRGGVQPFAAQGKRCWTPTRRRGKEGFLSARPDAPDFGAEEKIGPLRSE